MADDEAPTKVEITVAGHTVIVEARDDLHTVAAKALDLFTTTADYAKRSPVGYATTPAVPERDPLTGIEARHP